MTGRDSSFKMLAALSLISLMSGVLIVGAVEFTRDTIRLNRAEMVRQSIIRIFPSAQDMQKRVFEQYPGEVFYETRNSNGKPLGLAVEASGMGFQDVLKILYGYDPFQKAIVGLIVLESKETPGLGDKIEKDPAFQKNFKHLPVRQGVAGETFKYVKKNEKSNPWEIEGITGATISAKAICKILNASARRHLPFLEKKENGKHG